MEKVGPVSRWSSRGNVTRATYAVTTTEPKASGGHTVAAETRRIIDKMPKATYSHEANLTGRNSGSQKRLVLNLVG